MPDTPKAREPESVKADRSSLPGTTRERRLTHGQYEELRTYEHGHPSYRFRSPGSSLTRNDWLKIGVYGHDRASSAFQITETGLAALAAYRERWKVPA